MNDNNVIPLVAYPRVKAEAGTVISGTLIPADLVKAFADELARLASMNPDTPCFGPACKLVAIARHWLEYRDDEAEGDELIGELGDMLDEFAPKGHSFGAHVGDGADFGFWPCEDLQ